jgi:competence protein ComEC
MRIVSLGFLVGILSASALPVMPQRMVAAGLFVAAVLALTLGRSRMAWPASACIGFGWMLLAGQSAMEQRLETPPGGRDQAVTGRVTGLPAVEPGRVRFLFTPDPVPAQHDLPSRIRVSWYRAPAKPAPGERWRLSLRLRAPRGQANPGVFDYERWLLRERIGATAYVRAGGGNRRLGVEPEPWSDIRSHLVSAVHRSLPDSPRAGMIAALLVGSGGIDQDQRRLLQQTGTSHLMAISGLHVGIAAGVGGLLGRWGWLLVPLGWIRVRQTAALLGGLGAAVLYAGLAGFGLPTVRALVMFTTGAALIARRRALGPWLAFSAALILILALDPLTLLGAGFWLSFGAVAGLLLIAPMAGSGGIVKGWLRAQWGVSVALVPALVVFYGQVPLLSPLANLVAVPLFSLLIVPLVLMAGLAVPLREPAAAAVLAWADRLLSGLLKGLAWMVEAGPAPLEPAAAPILVAGIAAAGAALALMPRGCSARGAAPALLLPLMFWQGGAPEHGEFELTVLDVGQGLSAVVQTQHHVLVFDAGPAWPGGDSGARNLAPFLRAAGMGPVDILVLSHPDLDHRGGIPGLLDHHRVRKLAGSLYPGLPMASDDRCEAGKTWRWDGVEFLYLHPVGEGGRPGNDNSCVLKITSEGGAALLTGDIEASAERRILVRGESVGADLVVAPHHGSRSSSSAAFVAAVDPDWVVYPAGFGNRWGFPDAGVRDRWQPAREVVTGEHGAVWAAFPADRSGPDVQAWRCVASRFWRRRQCPGDRP